MRMRVTLGSLWICVDADFHGSFGLGYPRHAEDSLIGFSNGLLVRLWHGDYSDFRFEILAGGNRAKTSVNTFGELVIKGVKWFVLGDRGCFPSERGKDDWQLYGYPYLWKRLDDPGQEEDCF